MKRKNDRLVALLGAVLSACACQAGCERKETVSPEPSVSNASSTSMAPVVSNVSAAASAPVVSNAPAVKQVDSRAKDAAYQAWVRGREAEKRLNRERESILSKMERLRERAKKALPDDATDAQVTEELENNPRKYPGWRELVTALEKNAEKKERNNAAVQARVRRRMQRETAGQTPAKQ